MINNIIGEKTINSRKEIVVISILSNNIQYEMTEPFKLKLMEGGEKQVLNKTYTSRIKCACRKRNHTYRFEQRLSNN